MSQKACPFASTSVTEHLVRGAGAVVLIVLAFWLFHTPGALRAGGGAVALAGAIALMRGCPTCWTIGFIATLFARRRAMTARDSGVAGCARPPSFDLRHG